MINARRRDMGQKLLAIAQIVDEMYDAVVNQQDVLLGGHYILPDSRHSTGGLIRAPAYSALFDHGLASKSDQRFASIRSTGNLTFSTAF